MGRAYFIASSRRGGGVKVLGLCSYVGEKSCRQKHRESATTWSQVLRDKHLMSDK